MLSPPLSATVQDGLNPLSAIRESTWDSSFLEISLSVLLRCSANLRAQLTGFIFPQWQTTRMQFLMVCVGEGGQGWAMGPLQVRGWSLPSLAVSCHPCWEGEGAINSACLKQNVGDAAVASS